MHTLDNSTKSHSLWPLLYRHQDRDLNTSLQPARDLKSTKSQFLSQPNTNVNKSENASPPINTISITKPLETSTIQTTSIRIATHPTESNGITKSTKELNHSSSTPKETTYLPHSRGNNPPQISSTTERSFSYNVVNHKSSRQSHKSHSNGTNHGQQLPNAMWGRWQKWTKCSRSCGGGVMAQTRHCLSR